ncbi:MAG: ABC transporter substrate-binding protein [Candidatus Hodarchaeota archaeon]
MNFSSRRELVRDALKTIVWEIHPVMGLYQQASIYALDAALRSFDGFRWLQSSFQGRRRIPIEEFYYEDWDQSQFILAANDRFQNLNPVLARSYTADLIISPTRSWTYQRDGEGHFKPVLATSDPIALGSNDTIASIIDISTISSDSPYANADNKTTWGPNPNVNSLRFNPYKTRDHYSMLLINLRSNIPWHPGWGYKLGQRNVTVDDIIWSLGYWLEPDFSTLSLEGIKQVYGLDPTVAIQKINETMFKLNLRGPLANGQYADWLEACALGVLPQHVLDPSFNASPYGGDMGVTPDGTEIATYSNHSEYAFNTGAKPIINVGPYYFESWDETALTATLRKFDEWGGISSDCLWNQEAYSMNNIDTYAIKVYSSKEKAEIDLENEKIDGIDAQFQLSGDTSYLQSRRNVQLAFTKANIIQCMGYNTMHLKLSNRYLRLAISHVAPVQNIIKFRLRGQGYQNEVVGLALGNPYYPIDDEWKTIGLAIRENTIDQDTGEELCFQGHIDYNLPKAWALMEKAGYDMSAHRHYFYKQDRVEDSEYLPIYFSAVMFMLMLGAGLLLMITIAYFLILRK